MLRTTPLLAISFPRVQTPYDFHHVQNCSRDPRSWTVQLRTILSSFHLSSYPIFPSLFPSLYVFGPCSISGVHPFSTLPPPTHCFGVILESIRAQLQCVLWLEACTLLDLFCRQLTPFHSRSSSDRITIWVHLLGMLASSSGLEK